MHKAQGLTLDCVEVDCRNMNFPGQLGVAVGRAVKTDGLRVINFDKCYMHKQPESLEFFYKSDSALMREDMECCTQSTIHAIAVNRDIEFLSGVVENWSDSDSFDEEPAEFPIDTVDTVPLSDEDELPNELPNLPDEIDLKLIIESNLYQNPQTSNQIMLDSNLNYLLAHIGEANTFFKWILKHLNAIFESHIQDETAVESKQLTKFHKGVVSLISKNRYKSMVGEMFSINEASGIPFRAAYGILEELRKLLMMNETEDVIDTSREKASRDGGRSFKTSEAGKVKVRYISGWCMASLKHHKKSYVKRNLYSVHPRENVNTTDEEVKCLEELVVTEEEIFQITTDLSSLMDVKIKQNILKGLTIVTDSCFQFFLDLDDRVRRLETMENLNIYSKNLYMFILNEVFESQHP